MNELDLIGTHELYHKINVFTVKTLDNITMLRTVMANVCSCVLLHNLHNAGVMEGSNKQRLKHLLVETIQVLCKNSLPDESSFCIEATIGITLSSDRVTVISFKEHINSDGSRVSLMITDEQDYEQQWSKKTNDETEKHRYESWPRSSCSNNNNEQHLASKYPAICQQSVIRQTRNISRSVDHEVGMLEDNVDSSTEPSRIALFGSTDVSTANHYSIPMIGKCCTVTQSPTDCQTDSNDDVVIFKVEEGTDNNAAAVSGVQQFGTEVEAPALHSRRNKPKHRRARFGGNVVHNRSVQPMTSTFLETDETQQQHIAESHQQTAASDVS